MDTAIYIFLVFYFAGHMLMLIGLFKNKKRRVRSGNEFPFVSVIVAAKNEESNIAGCIESLLALDYPKDKLEIILVNDRSTDRTKEIMQNYTAHNPVLKYIETTEPKGKLKGKVNALAVSIKASKGEVIFTTDADIKVKPSWVSEMINYYEENTGVISSFSIIDPVSVYTGFQSIDWLYLLGTASGCDGINTPISCIGNNMSYRRTAYDEVGGYEEIKYSVTEDFMLMHTIDKTTKYKTRFLLNSNIVNETYACSTFKELYRQKKRWTSGGLDSHSHGITVGVVSWLSGLVMLFGWLAGIKPYLIYVIGRLVIDMIFIFPIVKEFKMWKAYLYMPFFEIYFAFYVFLMPFVLTFDGKVIWKEEKVNTKT